jgi:hypothetical protein
LYIIQYQYKYFLEHYMYVYLVSKVGRLTECFTVSINRAINEIDLAIRDKVYDSELNRTKTVTLHSHKDDPELWLCHYQMLVDCSKLVNICFGSQVIKTFIHTYHARLIPEKVAEASMILLQDAHVLPKLLS